MRNLIFALLLVGMGLPVNTAMAERLDYRPIAAEIVSQGQEAVSEYVPSQGPETAKVFSDLYFNEFKGKGMETALALESPDLESQMESLFTVLIGVTSTGAPKDKVQEAWDGLRARLQVMATDSSSDASESPWSLFLQSFLILIREGFEALLIVTALAAYLRRGGQADKLPVVYRGVGLAVAASLLTAYVSTLGFEALGRHRETLEGMTLVAAAAVLFYVSYWLFSKREAERWKHYLESRMSRALGSGSLFALGFAAFLAVYREGAETVLFYQALLAGNPGHPLAFWSGLLAATAGLVGLYWVMRSASLRLPLGPFFAVTAGLLYFLALVFAGKGVLELQEAHWLPITPLDWLPQVSWLGLYPSLETLAAQLLLLLPVVVSLGWWLTTRPHRNA